MLRDFHFIICGEGSRERPKLGRSKARAGTRSEVYGILYQQRRRSQGLRVVHGSGVRGDWHSCRDRRGAHGSGSACVRVQKQIGYHRAEAAFPSEQHTAQVLKESNATGTGVCLFLKL